MRRVYWIGQPIMPSSSYNSQIQLMNGIYRRASPRSIFGVHYVDTYSLLSKNGAYSQYLTGVDGETCAGARAGRRAPHVPPGG